MPDSRTHRWLIALLIFAGAIAFFAPPLLDVPFSTRGEAREGLVVTAMLDQDELVLPLRNGTVIPSKPPLFHWIGRGMVSLLGIERQAEGPAAATVLTQSSSLLEFAIRLPSVLGAAICLALLFAWLEPVTGRKEAWAAVLVLGTSFELMRSASIARVDMVFAATLTAGLIALNIMIDRYSETRRVALVPFLGAVIALAAATLAKGPAGLALPWAIAVLYVLFLLPLRAIPFGWAAGAMAASLVLALGWYVPAYMKGGEPFLDVHLMRENVARIVGMDDYETGHAAPFYMTTLLFLAAFLPWTLLLPLLGSAADYRPKALLGWFRRPVDARERIELFSLLWLLFFIVFFSFTASKRSAYLLPALCPAAALLGPALVRNARGRWRSCAAIFGTLAAVLGVVAAFAAFVPAGVLDRILEVTVRKEFAREQARAAVLALRENPASFAVLALGIALIATAAHRLWTRRAVPALYALAAGSAGIYLGVSTAITPTIARAQTPRPFMQQILADIGSDAALSQFKHDFYAATFYADPYYGGRNIPLIDTLPAPREKKSYVLAASSDVDELRAAGVPFEIALASSSLNAYGKDRLVLLELTNPKASLRREARSPSLGELEPSAIPRVDLDDTGIVPAVIVPAPVNGF